MFHRRLYCACSLYPSIWTSKKHSIDHSIFSILLSGLVQLRYWLWLFVLALVLILWDSGFVWYKLTSLNALIFLYFLFNLILKITFSFLKKVESNISGLCIRWDIPVSRHTDGNKHNIYSDYSYILFIPTPIPNIFKI